MALQVKLRLRNLTYQCGVCFKLKSPKKDEPHVIATIASIMPNAAGQTTFGIGNMITCPDCHTNMVKEGNFIDISEANQQQPFIDTSAKLPEKGGSIASS